MYVNKLLKDKRPAQGRVRRPWSAWSVSSDGDNRGISSSSGSEFFSSEKFTSCVVTPPPMSFSKQVVRSLTSGDDSDLFFKPLRLGRVKKGLSKQLSASGVAAQPSSPSSYGSSGSRSSYGVLGSKGLYQPRMGTRKQKSQSGPHSFRSGSSNLIESSDHDSRTRTESTGSSQSDMELQDESDVSESCFSTTQKSESVEEPRNMEKIECLQISSPQSNEEALVVQLKIPHWSTQRRLESLDVEYLAFKEVPAMKKCVKM